MIDVSTADLNVQPFVPSAANGYINLESYWETGDLDKDELELVNCISADRFMIEPTIEGLREVIEQCLDEHGEFFLEYVNEYIEWTSAEAVPLTASATLQERFDRYLEISNKEFDISEKSPGEELFENSLPFASIRSDHLIGEISSFTRTGLYWHLGA